MTEQINGMTPEEMDAEWRRLTQEARRAMDAMDRWDGPEFDALVARYSPRLNAIQTAYRAARQAEATQ